MRINPEGTRHLTYCLNVHAGESWRQNADAIRQYACAVRDRMGVKEPFGLGLRLSAAAADTLANPAELDSFRQFLGEQNLYVFTINGFPYGAFHATTVKEQVYAPDWRDPARLQYTKRLASILAALLPDGVDGSISTAPGSYKAWIHTPDERRQITANLVRMAEHMARLADATGREVHLGLEPEPDCLLETTDEALTFFADDIPRAVRELGSVSEGVVRRHVGLCFDACHMAVQFEEPAISLRRIAAGGIRVSKVQLSAALKARGGGRIRERLGSFADSVYLHQVRVRTAAGDVLRFRDLPPALGESALTGDSGCEWRVHCHVPLYWDGQDGVSSTADELNADFFQAVVASWCTHLELETYTFDVLPPSLRERGVVASVADEYRWFLERT